MDSGSTVSTTTAVIIALSSGLLGSTLGILRAFVIAWRSETRNRRARLLALEYELRGDRLVMEGLLAGQLVPARLSCSTWSKLSVELALDVSSDTYLRLQDFYWLYPDRSESYERLRTGGANDQERRNLEHWRELCDLAQLQVTGELH